MFYIVSLRSTIIYFILKFHRLNFSQKNIFFLSKIGFLYCLWNILAKSYVYYFWPVWNVSFRDIDRLSLDKNAHSTVIDWLELVEAVQKQSCK